MATRLRSTFKYPSEGSDDDDVPEHMDEQEQENLITKLRQDNESRNTLYTNLFTALLLLLVVAYAYSIFTSPQKLLRLLSVTSFLSTSYILVLVPLRVPDPKGKRPIRGNMDFEPEQGPVELYLETCNVAVCVLLAIAALVQRSKGDASAEWWVIWLVPGIVFGMVTGARRLMRSVNVGELETLKYRYKGA